MTKSPIMGWLDDLKQSLFKTGANEPAAPCEASPCEQSLHSELNQAAANGTAPVRYHMLFSGDVQGVGFRWTNQSIARKHNLSGWARNLPDGTVAVEIQGPPSAIARHLELIHASYARTRNRIWLEEFIQLDANTSESDFDVHM